MSVSAAPRRPEFRQPVSGTKPKGAAAAQPRRPSFNEEAFRLARQSAPPTGDERLSAADAPDLAARQALRRPVFRAPAPPGGGALPSPELTPTTLDAQPRRARFNPPAAAVRILPPAPPSPEEQADDAAGRSPIDGAEHAADGATLNDPNAAKQQTAHERAVAHRRTLDAPVTDKNGMMRSGASGALKGIAMQPQTRAQADSFGHLIGRALGGFAAGAFFDRTHDEKDQRARDVARADAVVKRESEIEEQARDARHKDAQTGKVEEETKYLREVKPKEQGARALRDARNGVLAQLRAKKGTRLSPDDPLVAEAARVGVHVDVDAFNNSKANTVRYVETDPDNPQRTRTIERNVVTGEEVDLGQKGFQQPVGADGMTAAQREQLDLGRQRVKLQAETLDLNTRRFLWESQSGIPASAKRTFDLETGSLQKELTQRMNEIKSWQQKVESNAVMPDVGERHIKEIEGRVSELQSQIDRARQRALSKGGGASSGGARMYTEAEVRQRARDRREDEDAAVAKVRNAGRLKQ